MSRPNSESNLQSTKQKRNAERSIQAESALEINRVKSSPAIPLHAPTSQSVQNYPEDRDLESLGSVSLITDHESSVVERSHEKPNQKSKNPYETNSKKSKKTKKEEKLNTVPNNTPPNFDLLAKFALEKER